ncbi:cytochrome P450 736A117-like [Andrographis paniculata]|uniref:cytochrome P450 736A117-like n=1 Tax=Andrographis paniculata TaxID=175694 RepID=UPI0021E6FCD9|nr:cytochrome P450 736A117-like [Andrographis paniculata]
MADLQFYAILFTLLSTLCAWYFTRRPKKNPMPSPPSLPVVGNLHQLGKLPHRSMRELAKKHGSLMLLHLGSIPTIVVSSPAAAREIFKTNDVVFLDKPAFSAPRKLFYDLKDPIHMKYGELWRKLRGIFVQELLSSSRVRAFGTIREEEVMLLMDRLRESCRSGSPINLSHTFVVWAYDLISRAAFGKKYSETTEGKKFVEKIDEVMGILFNFTIGEFVPWLAWINNLNGFNAALDRYAKEKDEILDAVIEYHLNGDDRPSRGENFVDILLDIYKGKNPGLSIDLISVKGVIIDIFGAGSDTSSITLTWAMTELIRHPSVMKKLQDEVRDVMKGEQHISDEKLQKMPYLKAVIKETLRLHPPIPIYFRCSRQHVNLMGYEVEPNAPVLINAWALGRDPSCWNDPEEFIPERFSNSSVDFKGFDFCLLPFGAGRRMCPGLAFAVISIEHTLANFMQKFDWALPDGARGEEVSVEEKPGMTVGKKDPLVVVATKCYF